MNRVPWTRVAHAFRRAALPLASYYAVTLALPLANGAERSGAFVEHALVVLIVPPAAIMLACAVHTTAHALVRACRAAGVTKRSHAATPRCRAALIAQRREVSVSQRTGILDTQADGHLLLIDRLEVAERLEFPGRFPRHLIDQRQHLHGQLAERQG